MYSSDLCWHVALFQTLEYNEWSPYGVHLDMLTSVYGWNYQLRDRFFILTSGLGIGYGEIYPRTFWGKVLLISFYTMIVIFVPKNVIATLTVNK